jgi:indole-3-glycerol phosphate synthase
MEVERAIASGSFPRAFGGNRVFRRLLRALRHGVSVLTDERFFGGSFAALERFAARFDGAGSAQAISCRAAAGGPKAAAHGADAVLCMLSVLGDEEARGVMAEAERLGMDVLVEVHDEAELARALALGQHARRDQQSRPQDAEDRSGGDRAAGGASARKA